MSMDMDHGSMDHGVMDHGGMNHSGSSHGSSTCRMNMIFTWDPTDVCVVFEWWHIRGPGTLIASLFGIIVLGIGFEYLRTLTSAPVIGTTDIGEFDSGSSTRSSTPSLLDMQIPPPITISTNTTLFTTKKTTLLKRYRKRLQSVLYAIQVIYSFFLMLTAMTYNGWIIIAIGVGALVGHLLFGEKARSRTMCCD
ncbi:Ctr copper transporter family-domain-containing protein [Lipomyces chichibuensis]|uniref:Ctr copper transporter family-domain-containing protein n=1 Tax=Lipomyces chichibuensis TaxID=1546026 RepID=UPI0033431DA6